MYMNLKPNKHKIISFNMEPLPPLLKEGLDLSKFESLGGGGGTNFFARKGG